MKNAVGLGSYQMNTWKRPNTGMQRKLSSGLKAVDTIGNYSK